MSETAQLEGKEVGKYRVVALLGRGGMGDVYDAVDPALGRHVALKILPPSTVSDPKRLSRFIQEARAASALNHPHLVSIYEIGHDTAGGRDIHFIAMEKIDGATLRELLAIKRVPRKAAEVVLQITDAVAAAHGAGVIHRDLKPENVMVTREGYAKVLDFGLAKLQPEVMLSPDPSASTLAAPTASGVVLGTAGYMSPEQARGGSVDQRTDIFALGCILYELASGKRAFQGSSAIDTLHHVLHTDPVPLREIVPSAPVELQRIVKKAMAKDPDARYQSAREMSTDLRELIREPDSHRPRRAMPWAIAAGLLALALVAVAIFRMTHHPAPPPAAVQMQRLTVRGDVTEAAISPDGKYMAYVAWTEKGQSLMLRQLATGQDLELVPPSPALSTIEAGYWGHTFSPDGSAIYYGIKSPSDPAGALYRISTLGGRPERILNGIDSQVSFSPDEKQITYHRLDFPHSGESALMVAAIDGSGAHAIAVRRPPERFAPLFYGAPAWSPDGRLIATPSARNARPAIARVIGIDPRTGAESILADNGWQFVGQVAWLPKAAGLIVIAADFVEDYPAAQVWIVPLPKGTPRRLTHDVDQYRIASLTADGKSLVSVTFQRTSTVWRVPLDGATTIERATSGGFDGFKGVSFLPDGRLVFPSLQDGRTQLDVADLKSGVRSHLTHDANSNVFPAAFRGGIAYISVTPQGNELCVMSENGERRRVVAQNVDQAEIAASRDGKWLVYAVDNRLWRISTAGGPPKRLLDFPACGPAFSPAGDRIAFYYGPQNDRHLAVMPIEGDRVTWSVPATYYLPEIRWSPAADALFVSGHGSEFSNVWKQPLKGEATRVTHLREQYAMRFDVAPDGKSIALARGQVMRDAVLITGFE